MNPDPRIVFVGQGPNRKVWERGQSLARNMASLKRDPDVFVRDYCARLAVTGDVGRVLAGFLDLDLSTFFRRYERRNLNAAFGGKSGKGDAFDPAEGIVAARQIKLEGFPRIVLLGANVAACFGLVYRSNAGPETARDVDFSHGFADQTRILLLPHPSRVVLYWNDADNVARARAALRDFVFNP